MTKDEALRLALEFVEANHSGGPDAFELIDIIKAALEAKDEPVAWKWHQAPVKTQWGDEMVVADIAIDKDHTASIYCERDQTAKVEAMFTPPQRKPLTDELTDREKSIIRFAIYGFAVGARARLNDAAQDNGRHYTEGAVEAFAKDATDADALLAKLTAAYGIKERI